MPSPAVAFPTCPFLQSPFLCVLFCNYLSCVSSSTVSFLASISAVAFLDNVHLCSRLSWQGPFLQSPFLTMSISAVAFLDTVHLCSRLSWHCPFLQLPFLTLSSFAVAFLACPRSLGEDPLWQSTVLCVFVTISMAVQLDFWGGRDSSVGTAQHPWSEGRSFDTRQGLAEDCSSPELASFADSSSVSVPPPWYRATCYTGRSVKSVGVRLHLNTHAPWPNEDWLCCPCIVWKPIRATISQVTHQETLVHSRLSWLSHCGLIVAKRVKLLQASWSQPFFFFKARVGYDSWNLQKKNPRMQGKRHYLRENNKKSKKEKEGEKIYIH